MKIAHHALAGLATAFLLSGGAKAVTLVSAEAAGQGVDTGFSTPSLIALDIEMRNGAPIMLTYAVDEGEGGGTVGFNAVITNAANLDLASLTVSLSGASIVLAESVTPRFGAVGFRSGSAVSETVTFLPTESAGVDLGNPFSQAGAQDWLFGLDGLGAGDRFTVTLSAGLVPEPETWALVGVGLALVGVSARRSRRTTAAIR